MMTVFTKINEFLFISW